MGPPCLNIQSAQAGVNDLVEKKHNDNQRYSTERLKNLCDERVLIADDKVNIVTNVQTKGRVAYW